jgi:hypothetical protein
MIFVWPLYGNFFRRRRFSIFLTLVQEAIKQNGHCRIADVGGRMEAWEAFREAWERLPITVVLLNLSPSEISIDYHFEEKIVDARDLSDYGDNSFDLVFSNSVIEHVGAWPEQQRLASEIMRIAPRHFVQTPNFWFPIEPHYRLPFMHWLPVSLRTLIVRCMAVGFYPRATSRQHASEIVSDARLLSAAKMAKLFPGSAIQRERAILTKSLIAVR